MSSLLRTASWVIVRRLDGAALFETFSPAVADAINRRNYDVVPILTYLQQLNRRIKENA